MQIRPWGKLQQDLGLGQPTPLGQPQKKNKIINLQIKKKKNSSSNKLNFRPLFFLKFNILKFLVYVGMNLYLFVSS